jgi:hypothetical protein
LPRYRYRRPFKVTPEVLERMRELRRRGKGFKITGELCGVSMAAVQYWLSDAAWVRRKRARV